MKEAKVMAHIHSLNGEMKEITLIEERKLFGKTISNSFIGVYENTKCLVIFNEFTQHYYADDIYGIVED